MNDRAIHGGAFWEAIGPEFCSLGKNREIINADVLDAWFPPSPRVVESLRANLEWIIRTSPPTLAEGLINALSHHRHVQPQRFATGNGSSSLLFTALPRLISPGETVLILDPTYSEYAHVFKDVIGCRLLRHALERANGFRFDPMEILDTLRRESVTVVALVNPNSPAGHLATKPQLTEFLASVPSKTLVWIDETYIDYADPAQTMEPETERYSNLVILKSLSKVYALSGLRVAYMVAAPEVLARFTAFLPPWSVSLPAQIAAVESLADSDYYEARWNETRDLRAVLADELRSLEIGEVFEGEGNFVLLELSTAAPPAEETCRRAASRGLYLRDASSTGTRLGDRMIRIAVKDRDTIGRMMTILADVTKR